MKMFLQVCVLVKLIQYFLRVGVCFQFNNYAHAFAVGFVADIADAFYSFVGNKFGNVLDEFGLVYLVRDFGDDNIPA